MQPAVQPLRNQNVKENEAACQHETANQQLVSRERAPTSLLYDYVPSTFILILGYLLANFLWGPFSAVSESESEVVWFSKRKKT